LTAEYEQPIHAKTRVVAVVVGSSSTALYPATTKQLERGVPALQQNEALSQQELAQFGSQGVAESSASR
jgi:hypothetical protein